MENIDKYDHSEVQDEQLKSKETILWVKSSVVETKDNRILELENNLADEVMKVHDLQVKNSDQEKALTMSKIIRSAFNETLKKARNKAKTMQNKIEELEKLKCCGNCCYWADSINGWYCTHSEKDTSKIDFRNSVCGNWMQVVDLKGIK
jgi:23S rRNA C2498 (ribose-2'-O)-methylase RlmM